MARIKAVLNERRLAYEGAMKLAEKECDAAKATAKSPWTSEDKKIVDYLRKHRTHRTNGERVWDQVDHSERIPA